MVFGKWRRSRVAARRGAKGYRAYAIGDVHGRLDLLDGLLAQIEQDHAARPVAAEPLLVFLGDLIDRGPDSRGVLERIMGGPLSGFRTIALCGNHEEVLLRLLEGERGLLERWLYFGGDSCVRSYGGNAAELRSLPEDQALRRLRELVPAAHWHFIADMADTFRFGDYLFVHAGIRPGIKIGDQTPRDLRWIREEFLSDSRDHGMVVVHGHTISETVEQRPNRIGVDTGAYHSGVLSALGVDAEGHWLLQQAGPGELTRVPQ